MSGSRARGFSLIEVLLATALLAAGIAIAFATLGAIRAVVEQGQRVARHNERVRAVERVLRARLLEARPLAFAADGESTRVFSGGPEEMVFAARIPPYLGYGGPYRNRLRVTGPEHARRLELDLHMIQDGLVLAADAGTPEVLADALRGASFRYRGLDADGVPGPWQDRWDAPETLPLLVEIRIDDGSGRAWPPVVVALPLASGRRAVAGR